MVCKGYVVKIPFSPAEAQEAGLLAADPKLPVYMEGRGAETLLTCLKAFRNEPGELWVFGGYRAFGGSRAAIMEVIRDIKRRELIVVDKMNNERSDKHDSEMLARALAQIAGSARMKNDRKHVRKIAQKGAATRAANNQAAKERILAADIQKRLGEAPELSWRRKAEILGEPWTASSLFRAYGKKPKSK